jgi:hypothetical protein
MAPLNFVFSLQAVPVFEWEATEPADGTAATPAPVVCDSAGSEAKPQPLDTSPPAMRLVFKGYEWRPGANCVTFPRPTWESCFAGGSDEENEQPNAKENERRARENELTRRPKPHVSATVIPNATDNAGDVSPASDPSELDRG